MKPNENNNLICCFGCGRDTTATYGYCYRCIGRGRQMLSERTDRHVLHFDGDPITEQFRLCDKEDNYHEESMGPIKPQYGGAPGSESSYPDNKAETRHFNLMKTRANLRQKDKMT